MNNPIDELFAVDTPEGLAKIHAAYAKYFVLSDDEQRFDAVEIVMAVVVANRFAKKPVWLLIVSPPASGKTMDLSTLELVEDIHHMSKLTVNTFVSGYITEDGSDASLLRKIDSKTIVMPEFGIVMGMHHDKKIEVYSQLRGIYDGRFYNDVGTGQRTEWQGKVGFLAGATNRIYKESGLTTALGERFLIWCLPQVDRVTAARRAMDQANDLLDPKFVRLQFLVREYLSTFNGSYKKDPLQTPEATEETKQHIIALAEIVAQGRMAVLYDEAGDIDFIMQPEFPTRIANQLLTLGQGVAKIRGEDTISNRTFQLITRVAYDTIPETQRRLIHLLARRTTITVSDVERVTNFSNRQAQRILEGMRVRGLAQYERGAGSIPSHWHISDELRALMRRAERN